MAGTGVLSKGVQFQYKKGPSFVTIPDLMEVPEIGGTPEQVDVTTLADGAKRYIAGIKDFGDLQFKFLYDNSGAESSFRIMNGLETSGAIGEFKVTLPDGTSFIFSGSVSNKLDSVGVNAPLTFTSTLSLNSDVSVEHPQTMAFYERSFE